MSVPNTCLHLTSYFFSFKSSLLKLSLFLTSSAPNYWKRLKIHCRAKTDNDWFLYIDQAKSSAWQIYLFLLDFIYRGSLFSIFTTLIYHKVLINNKTEQDTKQDKQTNILVEQLTYILTWYIWTVLQCTMFDENMRKYLKNKNTLLLRYANVFQQILSPMYMFLFIHRHAWFH